MNTPQHVVPDPPVVLSRLAMATRFEITLFGASAKRLRAAGEEALDLVEKLERRLSLYRPDSDISALNRHAHLEPVRVEAQLFRLLQQCKTLWEAAGGAFDVTITPLMRAWGFAGGTGRIPGEDELEKARARTGMDLIELNGEDFRVRFRREGVELDLGAIGKGYAVDLAAQALREAGVARALVHAGTSSICAIGSPPGEDGWKVGISNPANSSEIVRCALLRDSSLSVSGVHGKSFSAQGVEMGHVIDPRSGRPTQAAVLAAVACESATDADALSTALLVLGKEGLQLDILRSEGTSALVLTADAGGKVTAVARGAHWN